MQVSSPTNPFHIARAYGVPGGSRLGGPAAGGSVGGARGVEGVEGDRQVDPGQVRISRLIAGTVRGSIEFGDGPGGARVGHGGDAIAMYRRPGEQNAVATAVSASNLGRAIDLRG